jgi:hypothetical protein
MHFEQTAAVLRKSAVPLSAFSNLMPATELINMPDRMFFVLLLLSIRCMLFIFLFFIYLFTS